MILFNLLFALFLLFTIYSASRNPFYGLLVMIGINPIESLLPFVGIISLGRIVAVICVISWLLYLLKHQDNRKRLLRSRLNMVIWVFPLVCLIGVVFNGNVSGEGYTFVFKVFLLAFMSIMIENLIDCERKIYQLIFVIAVSSLIASIFPVASFYDIDLYTPFGLNGNERNVGGRSAGLTNNANALGVATSMGLFSILILSIIKSKIWLKILINSFGFIMIIALFLSGSRTHIIAVFICAIILILLLSMSQNSNFSNTILILMILSISSFFVYQSVPEHIKKRLILTGKEVDASTYSRADFSRDQKIKAINIFYSHPLFGVGLDGFKGVKDKNNQGFAPHDTVSLLIGETGLLGILSFLWLSVTCWIWLYRSMIIAKKINLPLYHYIIGFMSSYVTIFIIGWGGYGVLYERWFWVIVGVSPIIYQWLIVERLLLIKSSKSLPHHK